jgi:FdhD protein
MTNTITSPGLKKLEIEKVCGAISKATTDLVSVEEPLEISISRTEKSETVFHQIAVTMRTPGDDRELAAGFLFTEGIISGADCITDIEVKKCNSVNVHLRDHVEIDPAVFARHSFVASSCGVCGKKTIAAVRVKRYYTCLHEAPLITPATIHSLPFTLRSFQTDFERTGGIHASCLFDNQGKLLIIKEDVGRHNALDKLIGAQLLQSQLPLTDSILMVSGRASFELVQKAAHAGIAVIAAVGAPSSLAVELAAECDMTLIGFVRDERFNIYTGRHRIAESARC